MQAFYNPTDRKPDFQALFTVSGILYLAVGGALVSYGKHLTKKIQMGIKSSAFGGSATKVTDERKLAFSLLVGVVMGLGLILMTVPFYQMLYAHSSARGLSVSELATYVTLTVLALTLRAYLEFGRDEQLTHAQHFYNTMLYMFAAVGAFGCAYEVASWKVLSQ